MSGMASFTKMSGEHGDYLVFDVHRNNKRIWRLRVETWQAIAALAVGGIGAVILIYSWPKAQEQNP